MDRAILNLCDPFMLYGFAAVRFHLLPQKVVSGRKYAPGQHLSDGFLGLVPVFYLEGTSLTLDEGAQIVPYFHDWSGSGVSAAALTLQHGPLAQDGLPDYDSH